MFMLSGKINSTSNDIYLFCFSKRFSLFWKSSSQISNLTLFFRHTYMQILSRRIFREAELRNWKSVFSRNITIFLNVQSYLYSKLPYQIIIRGPNALLYTLLISSIQAKFSFVFQPPCFFHLTPNFMTNWEKQKYLLYLCMKKLRFVKLYIQEQVKSPKLAP